ncbi:MAG TPA: transglycosylase SLT domain-containing protein [Gallionellaceae bacterium]
MLKNRLFSLVFPLAALLAAIPVSSTAGEMLAMDNHLSTSILEDIPHSGQPPRAENDPLALVADIALPQRNLWQHIRSGFGMSEMDSPLVTRQERFFASQPDYVVRITERSRLYLYFIVREVERRGMPTEIALLPMIESAFNPTAYSPSNASGIWQFIPSTGKHFGMQQNWWRDGRRDVINATNGALDYLQKLHDQFGDWELALAAYNCGENCVERALKRNRKLHKPLNFVSLKLPKETRNYVPKLLAVKNIISNPDRYGIVLADVPNQPYFAAITPSRHIDVNLAADLAGVTLDDFKALNPGNSRPVILQDDSTRILIPANKAEIFMANLESRDKPLVSWQAYQSKKGEPLEKVAARFDTTVEQLRKANGLMSDVKVANGLQLLVPDKEDDPNKEFVAFNMHLAPTMDDGHALIHTVRRGESLGSIARRYHVSLASLKARNGGRTLIRPGQHLVVAGASLGGKKHHHRARVAKASGKPKSKSTSVSAAATAGRNS